MAAYRYFFGNFISCPVEQYYDSKKQRAGPIEERRYEIQRSVYRFRPPARRIAIGIDSLRGDLEDASNISTEQIIFPRHTPS
jgi:hypothetical protein